MMQSADLRYRDHFAALGRFDLARDRRVAIERQVRSRMMIIVEVIGEDPPKMAIVEHDDVVKALMANQVANLGLDLRRADLSGS